MAKFKCDAKTAERAQDFSFEMEREQFWERAQELANEIFRGGVKVYAERCIADLKAEAIAAGFGAVVRN